jgi:hypothetical protein
MTDTADEGRGIRVGLSVVRGANGQYAIATRPPEAQKPAKNQPAPAQAAASANALEILPAIDPAQDPVNQPRSTSQNRWLLRDGSLVYVNDGSTGKLKLPVEIIGRSMEIAIDATALGDDAALHLGLPADNGTITLRLVNGGSNLGPLPHTIAGKPWRFLHGERVAIALRVEKAPSGYHVSAAVDGKPLVDYTGDVGAVSYPFSETWLDGRSAEMVVFRQAIAFHSIRLTMLGSTARRI